MTKPQMPNPEEKEQKGTSFDYLCPCAFVEVQPLIYGPFLVSAWQLNTSPSAKQIGAVLGRGGGPDPNCRDGHSLTAAFILLLFLLHTQGFLGFLKYFCRSLLPLPLVFFFCHWAVIGCYDRAVTGLSASSKARFNYSFSLTWHVHAQMRANSHTHGKVARKRTHADTQTGVLSCVPRRPASNKKRKKLRWLNPPSAVLPDKADPQMFISVSSLFPEPSFENIV